MSNNIQEEIDALKIKIEELEKKKMLDNKAFVIDHNMQHINRAIQVVTYEISNNKYSITNPLQKYNDERLISYLTPIYNLLKITNERLDKLELSLSM